MITHGVTHGDVLHSRMQVVKQALIPLSVQETKDVETCVAGVRADKLKAETAAKAAAAKSMCCLGG